MAVQRLGYLVLDATDPGAWERFGTEVLGMAVGRGSGDDAVYLRMDDQPFRLAVLAADEDRLRCAGWQVADRATLEALAAAMEAWGVGVERCSPDEAAGRRVGDLVRAVDPGGAALELYCSPVLDHDVFVSPVGVSGFVTGELGMGHLVLTTPALDETVDFYTRCLGFRLSDTMLLDGMQLRFLRCNPRHHSLALAGAPMSALAHFMMEVSTVDDVGRALDRCEERGLRIKQGLGRHSNDHMLSFYAQTPARFDFEYGWGGRLVDEATWAVTEITKTSFWGHRRPPRPAK